MIKGGREREVACIFGRGGRCPDKQHKFGWWSRNGWVMITLSSCPHARQVFNVMVSGIFNRIGIFHRLTTMGTIYLHVEGVSHLRYIISLVCIMFGFPLLIGNSVACLLIIQPRLCTAGIAFIHS